MRVTSTPPISMQLLELLILAAVAAEGAFWEAERLAVRE